MPSGAVLHGLQARSYPGSAKDVGRGCRGLPGDGAEREPGGWSRVSSPSSLLSLGRCSGGGALRLRTFHSSLHTPSSGQPLIGYTWSDVSASFLFPHPPAFPCPSLSLPRPVRGMQLGCPSPREWDPMSSCESSAFCCLIYYPPATSVNPLPIAVPMATLIFFSILHFPFGLYGTLHQDQRTKTENKIPSKRRDL